MVLNHLNYGWRISFIPQSFPMHQKSEMYDRCFVLIYNTILVFVNGCLELCHAVYSRYQARGAHRSIHDISHDVDMDMTRL